MRHTLRSDADGRRMFFDQGGGKLDTTLPRDALPPDFEAMQAQAKKIHTLSQEEIDKLLAVFASRGYPTGERLTCVRRPENVVRSVAGEDGETRELVAPPMSEFKQNRLIVLESGPRAQTEVRLRKPLKDGTTKVCVDLLPGDEIQAGIYSMAEDPMEQLLVEAEILVVMARDVLRVIKSQEVERILKEESDG